MEALAETLEHFLRYALSQRLQQTSSARVQPVFVGPPSAALRALFHRLTAGGLADWSLEVDGHRYAVVVLLLEEVGPDDAVATPRSQPCTWDYAVTVRNSAQVSVTLVSPSTWDSRPESMANATDVLGAAPQAEPSTDDYFRAEPWPFVIEAIASKVGTGIPVVRTALRIAYDDARELLPRDRDDVTWFATNRLLGLGAATEIPLHVGLPSGDSASVSVDSLRLGYRLLKDLAKLCGSTGFEATRLKLEDAADGLGVSQEERDAVRNAVGGAVAHLRQTAGTGATFSRWPTGHFRDDVSTPWWQDLTCARLARLLESRPPGLRPARLRVTVEAPLNQPQLSSEPILVAGDITLRFPNDVGTVRVSRALPRQRPAPLWSGEAQEWTDVPPVHNAPITYRVEAVGYGAWTAKVVSLDTYGLHAFSRIEGAAANPVATGVGQQPEQTITLDRPGPQLLRIFTSASVSGVVVTVQSQQRFLSGGPPFATNIDCEHGDDIRIATRDEQGQAVSSWTLKIAVHEPDGVQPTSRFEALVVANQQRERRPRPVAPIGAANIRHLEQLWLEDARSWKGVLGAWSSTADTVGSVDWDRGTIGDLRIAIEVRPTANATEPPANYLAARDAIRARILGSGRTIAELDLDGSEWRELLVEYINAFSDWYGHSPATAAWSDCLAIHAPIQNAQARQEQPTTEPVALLLTPLHPVRLAWHAVAQRVLSDALAGSRCPSAGMLNPHAVPSSLGVALAVPPRDSAWRAFFATGIDDPHWALFWNQNHLRPSQERSSVLERLRWLGIQPRAITPGFTEEQARRSLQAVSGILPARVALRVGLIGSTQESDSCVGGILGWCEAALTDPAEYSIPPKRCDVYDLRDAPAGPSAARLASVGDQTGERVRWFRQEPTQPATLDVVVLDQLGTMEPRGVSGSVRSAVTPDTLFRLNVRTDLADGRLVHESRVVRQPHAPADSLEAGLLQAVTSLEQATLHDQEIAQLEFRPNQEAIGQRLDQALFVATTSSQLDPACLIRGVRNQQAYLWDYDLPGIVGLNEERAGYYLIASPPPALRRAVSAAVALVTDVAQSTDDILDEISRRGIPVLKRMAAGGNQARGEVGVLLAVRLLQDAFRRTPGSRVRLPIRQGECSTFILPLDPYWDQLKQLKASIADESSEQHPDLIVFSIRSGNSERTAIRVTPVEVKFRSEPLSSQAIGNALRQAANLGSLLGQLWSDDPLNELWRICGRGLLAQCLDHCFRIYADGTLHGRQSDEWTSLHEKVLTEVLAGFADVAVATEGRAIVLDGSPTSAALDLDGDRQADTVIVSRPDARALMDGAILSEELERAVTLMRFPVPGCADHAPVEAAPSARQVSEAAAVSRPAPEEATVPSDTADHEPASPAMEPARDVVDEEEEQEQEAGPRGQPDPIDPAVRARVRSVFADFVGNDAAVHRIANDLIRALIESPPHLSKNYLFTGQPSTGKTELAKRMAEALGLPFVRLDGRGVGTRDRLFDLVQQEVAPDGRPLPQVGQTMGLPQLEYPPMVVFIDEVHLMPRGVQESLLTMLEAGDRRVALRSHVALVGRATFLFATTRPSELDAALRSRCTEVPLREYELGEVAAMLERRFAQSQWSPDVYRQIAKLGRVVPRVAIELARELETEITVTERRDQTPMEHLDVVRRAREMDPEGLTREDARYLEVLDAEVRPLGENAIINMMGTVDRERVTNEIEPFLRRLGLIRLGPRGREITAAGREYVADTRRRRQL